MSSIPPLHSPEFNPDPDELRISGIRALRGPNHWRLGRVVACDVRLGALRGYTSATSPGFADRLIGMLPSLAHHRCTCDAPLPLGEQLYGGTSFPHILGHLSVELQRLAGCDVEFTRVDPPGEDDGIWVVVAAYEEERVGIQSIRRAAELTRACIARSAVDVQAAIASLGRLYSEVRLGPSTAAIVDEARRRGIPVRRLNARSLIQLGLGSRLRRIQATMTDRTSALAVEIAQDKEQTKRALEGVGLPVPRGIVVRTLARALSVADEIGYPITLKPVDGSHGRGVSSRLETRSAVTDAWRTARAVSSRVIVEHFHEGRDYRVLVVDGHVVACAERIPAHVIGDGVRCVRALVDDVNRDPRRGIGHTRSLTRIPVDRKTEAFLSKSGRSLNAVPAAGERVQLRGTANLSTGGTAIDRTDKMHRDNIVACELAAAAIGLDIAGIDVVTSDIAIPFRAGEAVILEVNAAPGIRMHTYPTEGKARDVGAPILELLCPPGTPSTIPIVAVTGTNGKTTTARLIAHFFRCSGKRVGLTTTDGVYIEDRLVIGGDMTGPFAANVVLSNPAVDVAVLETARGGIIRSGLGFDECDVGVVLNVSADHLGLHGITTIEQLAEVKGVVPAVVRQGGHAVLNADDPLVYAMRMRTKGDVVLFSASDPSASALATHLAGGGTAAFVHNECFVIQHGKSRTVIAAERDVPLMLGGSARFQLENVLAAIATAHVNGLRHDDIRAALLSFHPSPSVTPGRLNIIRLRTGARVLVDYAHNPAAIDGLMELVTQLPAERRIGVITVPGDRRDMDIREAGRLAARFDHVIVKEDEDLRGRSAGEVSSLLKEGLMAGGLREECISCVGDECTAITTGLDILPDDGLLVVLAEKVASALALVHERADPPGEHTHQ